jgi:hypothetical protein
MNGAYLHLVINHIPIVGMPFAFFLLLFGLIRKSKELVQAGFVTLIILGIGAYPVVKTGGMAAHTIWGMPGVTRETIHAHAEAADWGFWGSIILGLFSLGGFWVTAKSREISKTWTAIALVGALWVSSIMAMVAHLGGLIRHPEIRTEIPNTLEENKVGAPASKQLPPEAVPPTKSKK